MSHLDMHDITWLKIVDFRCVINSLQLVLFCMFFGRIWDQSIETQMRTEFLKCFRISGTVYRCILVQYRNIHVQCKVWHKAIAYRVRPLDSQGQFENKATHMTLENMAGANEGLSITRPSQHQQHLTPQLAYDSRAKNSIYVILEQYLMSYFDSIHTLIDLNVHINTYLHMHRHSYVTSVFYMSQPQPLHFLLLPPEVLSYSHPTSINQPLLC